MPGDGTEGFVFQVSSELPASFGDRAVMNLHLLLSLSLKCWDSHACRPGFTHYVEEQDSLVPRTEDL